MYEIVLNVSKVLDSRRLYAIRDDTKIIDDGNIFLTLDFVFEEGVFFAISYCGPGQK